MFQEAKNWLLWNCQNETEAFWKSIKFYDLANCMFGFKILSIIMKWLQLFIWNSKVIYICLLVNKKTERRVNRIIRKLLQSLSIFVCITRNSNYWYHYNHNFVYFMISFVILEHLITYDFCFKLWNTNKTKNEKDKNISCICSFLFHFY